VFIEPELIDRGNGWIEVICGSMFSGKTEELLRRLRRAQIARQPLQVYKPALDQRYSKEYVVSHDHNTLEAVPVTNSQQILLLSTNIRVVGIDEAQFFDADIVAVVNRLADSGKRVIVAGLDLDYRGVPFGPMPQLLAVAEFVTKLHAICARTGGLAHYSHRKTNEQKQIQLGSLDEYEPLSRAAFQEALKADRNKS
jgi:thymidine kinase